jgi:hypothetical protein
VAALAAAVGVGVVAALARAELERRLAQRRSAQPLAPGRVASRLQRKTLKQLDLAIALLEGHGEEPPERTVHETRKALKRARALVRLQRDALGRKRFAREDATLRRAGRALAVARDAEVVVQALDALVQRHPRRLARSPAAAELRARLVAERQRTAAQTSAGAPARVEVLVELRAMRERVARWKPHAHERASARSGLQRIYRQGRRRWRRARRQQSSEALHQWRKRTKDLRYVAEMLRGEDPRQRERLQVLAQRADRLGETLGAEHDLALLAERVRLHRRCFKGEKPARRTLEREIAHQRERLRVRAWRLGERLYRRAPERFVRRALGA